MPVARSGPGTWRCAARGPDPRCVQEQLGGLAADHRPVPHDGGERRPEDLGQRPGSLVTSDRSWPSSSPAAAMPSRMPGRVAVAAGRDGRRPAGRPRSTASVAASAAAGVSSVSTIPEPQVPMALDPHVGDGLGPFSRRPISRWTGDDDDVAVAEVHEVVERRRQARAMVRVDVRRGHHWWLIALDDAQGDVEGAERSDRVGVILLDRAHHQRVDPSCSGGRGCWPGRAMGHARSS